MRKLESMIAEWRARMAAGGIKSPAVLDELESHLREEVERNLQAGRDEAEAFENAVERMGRSDLLGAEFAKIEESEGFEKSLLRMGYSFLTVLKEKRMSRIIGIACCVFASLYSLLLAPHLFLIHELSPMQRILGLTAVVMTVVSLAGLRFNYKLLPVIRNKRIRTWIGLACGLVAVGWLAVFSDLLPNVIVPRALRHLDVNAPVESMQAVFVVGLSLLWAMTLAAILGGIAYGLEEAARRRTKMEAYV